MMRFLHDAAAATPQARRGGREPRNNKTNAFFLDFVTLHISFFTPLLKTAQKHSFLTVYILIRRRWRCRDMAIACVAIKSQTMGR